MNRENTKKCIAVMRAYVDGKDIVNQSGVVLDGKAGCEPCWNWATGADVYKVKPEPRECYVLIDMDDNPSVVLSKSDEPKGERVILMREVIKE